MAPFTEVTRTSLFGRLGKSVSGIFIGLLIFLLAFPLLFWNESRAVKRARTLDEGQGMVQTTSPEAVNADLEGALVHLSGLATTDDVLQDDLLEVSASGIKLNRVVEMYQWKESSKSTTTTKTGGAQETTTTYDYEQVWAPTLISDASFKVPAGHGNPGTMPFESDSWTADTVTLGAYQLSPSLVNKISGAQVLPLDEATINNLSLLSKTDARLTGDWVTLPYAGSAAAPNIGDIRIKYELVPETTVSIVAQQRGNSFDSYQSRHGSSINMLALGTKTANDMFTAAKDANTAMTWGLRILGYLMMAGGLAAVFAPLVVVASMLPFLGKLLGAGARLIAGVIAFFFTFITIAIAWVAVRPVLGISLIAIAAAVLLGGLVLSRQHAKQHNPVVPATA